MVAFRDFQGKAHAKPLNEKALRFLTLLTVVAYWSLL